MCILIHPCVGGLIHPHVCTSFTYTCAPHSPACVHLIHPHMCSLFHPHMYGLPRAAARLGPVDQNTSMWPLHSACRPHSTLASALVFHTAIWKLLWEQGEPRTTQGITAAILLQRNQLPDSQGGARSPPLTGKLSRPWCNRICGTGHGHDHRWKDTQERCPFLCSTHLQTAVTLCSSLCLAMSSVQWESKCLAGQSEGTAWAPQQQSRGTLDFLHCPHGPVGGTLGKTRTPTPSR